MTRRRADTAHPCPTVAKDDMSEAQRRAVQDVFAEQYHGRKDREAWDRRYWRGREGTRYVRPRVLPVAR